jgi:hypothetical protein
LRFGGRVAANEATIPPFDPVREAGARTESARLAPNVLTAIFRRDAPARCGAVADEQGIVAGGEGRRNARAVRLRRLPQERYAD